MDHKKELPTDKIRTTIKGFVKTLKIELLEGKPEIFYTTNTLDKCVAKIAVIINKQLKAHGDICYKTGEKSASKTMLMIIDDWDRWTEEKGGEEKFRKKYGRGTTDLLDVIRKSLEGKLA